MQLTYRGQSFNAQMTSPAPQTPGHLTRTLHYLGNTYTAFVSERPSPAPRAINWRHEIHTV